MIGTISRDRPLPVAIGQESFAELERIVPGTPFSTLAGAVRLSGPLDHDALQAAVDTVVDRQEALRTVFTTAGATTRQVVLPRARVPVVARSLTDRPADERWDAFAAAAIAAFSRPFDLERGPLLRVVLFRLAPQEHVLLLLTHHIVSDTWSLRVLAAEIAGAYAGAPLPALPVQFADFAAWQRDELEGPGLGAQLAYWRRRLSGGRLPAFVLPTDRPRPAGPTFRTAAHDLVVGPRRTRDLRARGREEGCTLFMVILAAYAIVLQRLAGGDEVRLGTEVAGRGRPELEHVIGLFINTVLLRIDLTDGAAVREVLASVREVMLETLDHQDVPFESVVRMLEREHLASRASLFPALLLFEAAAGAGTEADVAGLRAEPLDLKGMFEADVTVTSFDLILTVRERDDGLWARLTYKTALFSAAAAADVTGLFDDALTALADDPDRRLTTLARPARLAGRR